MLISILRLAVNASDVVDGLWMEVGCHLHVLTHIYCERNLSFAFLLFFGLESINLLKLVCLHLVHIFFFL